MVDSDLENEFPRERVEINNGDFDKDWDYYLRGGAYEKALKRFQSNTPERQAEKRKYFEDKCDIDEISDMFWGDPKEEPLLDPEDSILKVAWCDQTPTEREGFMWALKEFHRVKDPSGNR